MSATAKKGRHTSAIQNELLLASLTRFFSKSANIKVMTNIVNGASKVSLRLIDWFVTNYSKNYNVTIIKSKTNGIAEHINVYLHYRSQLRAFSKHLFDPFRRQDKIEFVYDKTSSFQTTIGQLNFFRWAIEHDVLTYIEQNYEAIVADINKTQKETKPSTSCMNHAKPSASRSSRKNSDVADTSMVKKTRTEKNPNVSIHTGKRLIQFD